MVRSWQFKPPDGRAHPLEAGSIRRLGNVDLAVLTFSSSTSYETARIGDRSSVQMGGAIYVSGFPLPSSAVPSRLLRFLDGQVIANALVAIPNGYQLLYSNPTLPGMSGGPVFNSHGELVGIHGQGETDAQMSEQRGVAVKTGTNQGVPIAYYTQAMGVVGGSSPVAVATTTARTADDYLALARQTFALKGKEQEIIRLTTLALGQQQSFQGDFLLSYAKRNLGDYRGAIADLDQAISIDPRIDYAYDIRGEAKARLGDYQGAIADFNQAISIAPRFYSIAYYDRGLSKASQGYFQEAITDFNQVISIDPRNLDALRIRGLTKSRLGDRVGSYKDFAESLRLGDEKAQGYWDKYCR